MTVESTPHEATRLILRDLADKVNQYLSQVAIDSKPVAFTLLLWPDGNYADPTKVNYVSNVTRDNREQVKEALESVLNNWTNNTNGKGGDGAA